jgi:light-harvesting protein B-800-850 alpha chain
MNQGRIWCVVSPSVGLPLLLGSVAVTSLIVHAEILSHTNWMSSYWAGSTRGKTALENTTPRVAAVDSKSDSAFSITVTPVAGTDAKSPASFVITVSPNSGTAANTVASGDTSGQPAAGQSSGPVRLLASSTK